MVAALNTIMSAEYNQSLLNKTRKDKFIMVLTPPPVLKDKITNFQRDNNLVNLDSFQFSVFGLVVPDVTVEQIDAAYGGQTLKLTSYNRPALSHIDVKFAVDNNYNNYWFIYYWLKTLNDPKTALPSDNTPARLLDYTTTITVYGLDEYNNKKIQFDYLNAKPISLGSISYDYRDANELETTATFSFFQLIAKLL